jgi:raffinose/stachyose/melibiose transport system permease protein
MNKTLNKLLKKVIVILVGLIYLVPFYILINVAFKPTTDTSSYWMLPKQLYLENFMNAWVNAKLGRAFKNNILITVTVVVIVILVGSFAAYPLARYKTKINNFVYTLSISCLIVPPLTILVPLYKLIVNTTGTSTYPGIVLPHVAFQLPITIFLYTGFISSISRELDEAALIDGSSRFGIFFRIIMPLLKPITSSVIIMVGVSIWNDYTFSVFFLQKPTMYTLTVSLSQFFSQYSNNLSWVAAGCMLSAIPMAILYFSLQKYFVKGLSAGAVKG